MVHGLLAAFFTLVGAFYFAKTQAMRHRDGRAPIRWGALGSRRWCVRAAFTAFRVALLAIAVCLSIAPEFEVLFGPIGWMPRPWTHLLGGALMVLGLWLVVYAHTYMGALWLSGVADESEEAPTALLQRGPFAWSRNPIFLGVLLGQAGYFFAWPSVFSLIVWIAGWAALSAQARIEERHLLGRFGPSYRAYAARTPRWL